MYKSTGMERPGPKRRKEALRPGHRFTPQKVFVERHQPLDTLKLAVPTKAHRANFKRLGVITSDSFPTWARIFEGKKPDKVIVRQRSGGITGFMSGIRDGDNVEGGYTCIGTLVCSGPRSRSYDVAYLMEKGKVRII